MPLIVFEEAAEGSIIENLMAVIHDNMVAELDAISPPPGTLPPFAVMTDGEVDEFSYPLIALGVESVSSTESDSGEWLNQDIKVGIGLAIVDSTSLKSVRKKAKKYVRALKKVIRKSEPSELLTGYASDTIGYVISVDHRYLKPGKSKDGAHLQGVEMVVRFQFGET